MLRGHHRQEAPPCVGARPRRARRISLEARMNGTGHRNAARPRPCRHSHAIRPPCGRIVRVDRTSFRRLRRQPGYPLFYATATITRFADDMFSVGDGAAGARPHRQRAARRSDGRGCHASEPRHRASAGRLARPRQQPAPGDDARPGACRLDDRRAGGARRQRARTGRCRSSALVAGITWPLSFGGFTSLIPAIVPEDLLPPANALEATSFNIAIIAGPALAGTISALASPAASLLDRGRADAGRDRR